MTVLVRGARFTDDTALVAIDRATKSTRSSPGPVGAPRASFFAGADRPEDFLVAESVTEGVIGYVALHETTGLASHADVLTIDGLGVLPHATRHGVGRRLVDAALERARELGARKVMLRVLAHNTEARALYAACGFEIEGVLRGEFVLDGAAVDDVLMAQFLA